MFWFFSRKRSTARMITAKTNVAARNQILKIDRTKHTNVSVQSGVGKLAILNVTL